MSRYLAPEMRCDSDLGCDQTAPDYYGQTASFVDAVRITAEVRAPGWFSTMNDDYCPEHLPWLAGKEKNNEPAD